MAQRATLSEFNYDCRDGRQGLRNIQGRTKAMQGRLEVYSEGNEGTTFFFILPLTATFVATSQETTQ